MIKFSVGIGSMGLCNFKKFRDIGMCGQALKQTPERPPSGYSRDP